MIATIPRSRRLTPPVPATFTSAPPDPSLSFGGLGKLAARTFRHVPATDAQDERSPSLMTDVNRRRFLQLAGATTAFSALSNSIQRAAALPAHHRTGTIEDVEHVVVLMQENRSFDHYFGSLRGVRGFGDPRPVTTTGTKSVWYQSDGTKDVLPFHPEADDLGLAFIQDLPHGWNDGHAAFDQGRYDKWVP